jgi:NAD(P)-dependent dehydrogenase (short-subunit alcohol dehydrogenase family)
VVILVTNRIVLVTGATRGIGKAVIEGVAAAGQTAILAGRDEARAAAAAKETGGEACPVVIDVTDQSTITAAAAFIRQRYGRLDSLVNNAGVNIGYERPPSQTLLTDMRAVFATDVFGVVAVTSAFLPLLRASDAPRIVNVSSLRGSLGSQDSWVGPWSASYGTAKTALNAVTVHYARELAPEGFAVTAVSPGHVATDLTRGNAPLTPAQGAAIIVQLALAKSTAANGAFLDENGLLVPW